MAYWRSMLRREFLQVVGGGAACTALGACDDGGGDAPIDAAPSCLDHGAIAVIAGNHGHSMIVTAAEVAAPMDREYDLTGGADHTHTAVVTAAQYEALAATDPIHVTSSFDAGHAHEIAIRCR